MNKLFSYDSPPMQILMFVGDLIILNVIYLLCCIPLFTIGAAQAGMYTACKVLTDKEDDSSPAAAFFRGFVNGFGTVTLAWGIACALLAVVFWLALVALYAGAAGWLVMISVGLCAIFATLIPAFHSRFGCKWWQLIRNSWFLLFAHPIRSILATLLVFFPFAFWAVFIIGFGDVHTPMSLTPIWGTLYFSTAMLFANTLLKKPFKTLTEHFNETHGLNPDGTPIKTEEDTESEEETEKIFSDTLVE